MKRHIAGRFVNVGLLDAAWTAVQAAEKDSTRSTLLHGIQQNTESEHPPQANLDGLSDEEIESLKNRTLREYVRQQRRG